MEALQPAKSAAKTCGKEHAAIRGQLVHVRLKARGSDGKVVESSVVGEDANTALGACVLRSLESVRFKPFEARAFILNTALRVA